MYLLSTTRYGWGDVGGWDKVQKKEEYFIYKQLFSEGLVNEQIRYPSLVTKDPDIF